MGKQSDAQTVFVCLQDDTFIPTMTCHETLTLYAGVTLGAGWTRSARGERVQEVLGAIGLTHAAHTQVGLRYHASPLMMPALHVR